MIWAVFVVGITALFKNPIRAVFLVNEFRSDIKLLKIEELSRRNT